MIDVGKTARHLRESLGLTQKEMAETLGITNVHLSNVENSKSFPSQDLIDRYRQKFEIDLYIVAWCKGGDSGKLPAGLREPAARLAKAWEDRFEKVVERHRQRGE